MKILVVGGGGREHAIIWKLKMSPRVKQIFCAPGNGGISDMAQCVNYAPTDIENIAAFAEENSIDMVVVAQDDPLALGMVDALEKKGIRAFGPNAAAALIEASKAYAKDFMKKYNIPTADYEVFYDIEKALGYILEAKYPLVIKADGLAAGKGVIIAQDHLTAKSAIEDMMDNHVFGKAGDKIVIEEFLKGTEITLLVFTDGKTVVPMVSSMDHKKVFDNDEGKNTGGMGAISPGLYYSSKMQELCMETIVIPSVEAMNTEGRPFKGVLYFGLILTDEGPKVIEYNSRFGDPEAQVILPRLKTDLLDIMDAIIDEKLDTVSVLWNDNACACIVAASGGYPDKYETGIEISIDEEGLNELGNIMIFHAGTQKKDGKYYTKGGRVLGVTAYGKDLDEALNLAYRGMEKVKFSGMHYRTDIGKKRNEG